MRLRSAAPIFVVDEVGATLKWYVETLGFTAHPFPATPPHVFGILERDGVEIMLQRLEGYRKPDLYGKRPGGAWDVYIRVDDVDGMYRALKERGVTFLEEPPRRQPYGDTEVVIRDPNGYVLVLSEGP